MSKVCVLRTSPASVIEDYEKLIRLAEVQSILPNDQSNIIKLNLSWTKFFPACSSPPWQLDGALRVLRELGYRDLVAVENQTVVTHPWKGAYGNKWLPILDKYGVDYIPLTDVEWVRFQPRSDLPAMQDIFEEILIPKIFMGKGMIHLPTVKTHGHTTTTGSMKNAFGGLIPKHRHHAHRRIHEVLVDLLAIQREIHPGIFTIMDGCVCGDGAGPRTMRPFIGNIILASSDPVSIDAAAAKIMGFDPMKIDYIRMAHERGLGNGDLGQIDIAGMDRREFDGLDFGFTVGRSPIIMGDQLLRKKTASVRWLHRLLFYSPIFKLFILSSEVYHDRLWYPTVGRRIIGEFLGGAWGEVFRGYEYGEYPRFTEVRNWNPY